jgi:hypothetical protein
VVVVVVVPWVVLRWCWLSLYSDLRGWVNPRQHVDLARRGLSFWAFSGNEVGMLDNGAGSS